MKKIFGSYRSYIFWKVQAESFTNHKLRPLAHLFHWMADHKIIF